jgi:predicted Zn-dependent peptidase
MNSFMLSIDTKRTAQVLLEKELKKYIESQGFPLEHYQEPLTELHNLRESLRNSHDKTESILATYYRYELLNELLNYFFAQRRFLC